MKGESKGEGDVLYIVNIDDEASGLIPTTVQLE